ncbi:hypothetical protein ScPMuIL_011792 [Solemya velum]
MVDLETKHSIDNPVSRSSKTNMAFLCPSRAGRSKKKKGKEKKLGRITGSDSVDTLVRVAYEKKRVFRGRKARSQGEVIRDFKPNAAGEIEVREGQKIELLYRENDWAYVLLEGGGEGFIPFSHCSTHDNYLPSNASSARHDSQRLSSSWCSVVTETITNTNDSYITEDFSDFCYKSKQTTDRQVNNGNTNSNPPTNKTKRENNYSSGYQQNSSTQASKFCKRPHGEYMVVFAFDGRNEDDVSVLAGEIVMMLNAEDPAWSWVKKGDNREGFVPRKFLYPLEVVVQRDSLGDSPVEHTRQLATQNRLKDVPPFSAPATTSERLKSDSPGVTSDSTFTTVTYDSNISEYVSMYDYSGKRSDDILVRRGDMLLVDSREQMEAKWYWAYSPKYRRYGYIPKHYVKVPLKTAI